MSHKSRLRRVAFPRFLQPEVLPYVDVVIVHDENTPEDDQAIAARASTVPVSHWIAPFTTRRPDGSQEAFCGTFIMAQAFSTDPSCLACQALMVDDAADLEVLRKEVW
jgi:hypothetical protein